MSSVVEYGARRVAVVAAVMLAALMQLADTTIVNVALPSIDGTLGASHDQGAWFITAYIIANVIVIPLTPWLQSIFGRKRYFAMSIAGFTLVSILCGLASDTNTEIALRFIQGAFGGGLMVPAQQIIRDTFPPDQLGKSQSLFALAIVIGPTIGPTLGGILTDDLSWRWVFFINVLPGIAAALLVLLFVRDPHAPKRIPVDGIGMGLLAVGLATMQYVLDEGERNGWFDDATIVMCTVVSVIALVRVRRVGAVGHEASGGGAARLSRPQRLVVLDRLLRDRRDDVRVDLHSAAVRAKLAQLHHDDGRLLVDGARRDAGAALSGHDLGRLAAQVGPAHRCGGRHLRHGRYHVVADVRNDDQCNVRHVRGHASARRRRPRLRLRTDLGRAARRHRARRSCRRRSRSRA